MQKILKWLLVNSIDCKFHGSYTLCSLKVGVSQGSANFGALELEIGPSGEIRTPTGNLLLVRDLLGSLSLSGVLIKSGMGRRAQTGLIH